MNLSYLVKFYSRKDVREEIVRIVKDRECVGRFISGEFLKRPGVIVYEQEVLDLVRKGVSSFHMSEERWFNPMQLHSEIKSKEMDELRSGWDLVIDIDSKDLEFSKICAFYVEEFIQFMGVEEYSIKFSGGKGFHILIPFGSFPQSVNGKDTKILFPEAPRIISLYIQERIKDVVKEKILEKFSLEQINQKSGTQFSLNEDIDVLKLVNLDPVAISPRHMIRCPYSFNEKTWLVSIPIEKKSSLSFDKERAKPENVKIVKDFFSTFKDNEAEDLFVQAYDFVYKKKDEKEKSKNKVSFHSSGMKISKEFFPPCIGKIMEGLEDGRKRALFILINFFKFMNWDWQDVVKEVHSWNERNKSPLSSSYVNAQLQYYKNKVDYMIPNCGAQNFYKGLSVCIPDNTCKKIKNPLNYSRRKTRYRK